MKSVLKDMTGESFGRLTVIGRAPKRGRDTYWLCRCNCGQTKEVFGSSLRQGRSRSCGCLSREIASGRSRGVMKHPLYHVWTGMKARCLNPNNEFYKDYGGRGIAIHATWLGKDGFLNFARDMGPRPSGHSIDRIENNGNYEPGNCRWAVPAQQNRNYRKNLKFTIGGHTKCLKDWCAIFGVAYLQTYQRLQRGWGIEAALTAKPRTRKAKAAFAPIAHEILNVLEATSGIPVATMMAEAA